MKKISFYKFILSHLNENHPIGDLARDISRDTRFPKRRPYGIMRDYLEGQNASSNCIETFDDAWNQYKGLSK